MNIAVKNPLGLKKIHHVEFYVGNAKQAEFYYRHAFGFSRAAYSGLETGNRETTSYVVRQNRVNFILTTPLNPEHPSAEHIKIHGDGVRDIAFLVEDADHAFSEAVKRGAKPVLEPRDWSDANGSVRHAAIAAYGDTIHSFISYNNNNGHNYSGPFLPGFVAQEVAGNDVGIAFKQTAAGFDGPFKAGEDGLGQALAHDRHAEDVAPEQLRRKLAGQGGDLRLPGGDCHAGGVAGRVTHNNLLNKACCGEIERGPAFSVFSRAPVLLA